MKLRYALALILAAFVTLFAVAWTLFCALGSILEELFE